MTKILFYFFLLSIYITSAQTAQITYYKSEYSDKQVSAEKANFSRSIIHHLDSSITTETRDLKKNEITNSFTYKMDEPFGLWKFRYGKGYKELNYNFELNNINSNRVDTTSIAGIKDFFTNNDSLGYKAPSIDGITPFYQYISKNLFYPQKAKEEGISGKVYLKFTILETGEITDIVVLKRAHLVLDKEAVRMLRETKFLIPPTLNGKPHRVRVLMPLSFKLM